MYRNRYEREETWDERTESSSCTKDSYKTERQALAKIDEIWMHKHSRDRLPIRPYLCDGTDGRFPCYRWHLTGTELGD